MARLARFLPVTACYVGAVVGAGFASGQEIWTFFGGYGLAGVTGLMLAGILFALVGSQVMVMMKRDRVTDYSAFLVRYVGRRLAPIFDIIISALLFGVFVVMVRGSSDLLQSWFGIGPASATVATICVLGASMYRGSRGAVSASTYLLPLLVFGLIGTSAGYLFGPHHLESLVGSIGWGDAASLLVRLLLYVAYNILLSLGVFASLAERDVAEEELRIGGMLGGLALGAMASLICVAIASAPQSAQTADMPLLELSRSMSGAACTLYYASVWAAMTTTALANLLSLTSRAASFLPLSRIPANVSAAIAVLASLPFLRFGFADLISVVYPLLGIVALFCLLAVPMKASLIWRCKS